MSYTWYRKTLQFAALGAALVLAGRANAATINTWNVASGGSWNLGSN
jgi:hypothetical protein